VIAIARFTLGWIRRRTNTTVAILVHAAYDAIAVLALQASR
jgi:membrane protease YdiL (CAAX protease family)